MKSTCRLLAIFLAIGLRMVAAQEPVAIQTAASGERLPAVETASALRLGPTEDRYRIGPGDVLEIRVFNRPQLSRDAVRVEGHGKIRMPLIEGEIQAACRTEGELAEEIARLYLKYQRNPQVDVFIKSYNSRPVAIIGAVNVPGPHTLQRRARLLELITLAGGPAPKAGQTVQVVHSSQLVNCEAVPNEAEATLSLYNLNETLKGEERANPFLSPGDVVTVPEADQVVVIGNVVKPISIPLKEPLTISRAIILAGGLLPDSKRDRVRIIRQMPGQTERTELTVDLKAIDNRQAQDISLQAGDVIEVPTASGKKILKSLLYSVVPFIGLPARGVVP